MTQDLAYKSAAALLDGFAKKRFSPSEVLDAVLVRIDVCEPTLNAFQLIDVKSARRAARASTERWAKARPGGALDGVPVAIKDVTETKGWPTLNGSLAIDPKGPWREDAVVVERFRASGAVIIGKTTAPEFAWRGITESEVHGITRNPWNPEWNPCGSSGGAAAAIATGMVTIATGTDSGGSIRGPASFCNVVGLKPTFGRVPVWPVSPMLMIEHCGPITRTVRDAALALGVMARFDARDGYALAGPVPDFLNDLERGVRGLRIAYSADLGVGPVDSAVRKVVASARRVFSSLGASVANVDLDLTAAVRISNVIAPVIAARLIKGLGKRRTRLSNPLLIKTAALADKIDGAAFLDAQAARSALRAQMEIFHHKYDLLIAPNLLVPPFSVGRDDPPGWKRGDSGGWFRPTVPFDLTGQPAISVPCGFTPDGAPIGVQIIGPQGADALVLRAARAFEKANPIGRKRPAF